MEKHMNKINKVIVLVITLLFTFNANSAAMEKEIKMGFELIVSKNKEKREAAASFFLRAPDAFKKAITAQYKQELNDLSSSLPQKIDEITTAQSAMITKDSIMMYYILNIEENDYSKSEINTLKTDLNTQTINQLCSMARSAVYMLYGGKIIRVYSYSGGALLLEARLEWSSCSRR